MQHSRLCETLRPLGNKNNQALTAHYWSALIIYLKKGVLFVDYSG
jgi:hypothetical protein